MLIEDGKGKGFKAEVDGNNRLRTSTISESEAQQSAELGNAYNINTGNITFSAAGTLLYIKNDEDQDMILDALVIGAGTASVSDIGEVTIVRNPTGGDLITDLTAVSMNQNRNFGSSKTLKTTTTAYKGKSGGTLTGGNDIILIYHATNSRTLATIEMIVPKGSSIGIKYDPKLSSGSVKGYCAAILHITDEKQK